MGTDGAGRGWEPNLHTPAPAVYLLAAGLDAVVLLPDSARCHRPDRWRSRRAAMKSARRCSCRLRRGAVRHRVRRSRRREAPRRNWHTDTRKPHPVAVDHRRAACHPAGSRCPAEIRARIRNCCRRKLLTGDPTVALHAQLSTFRLNLTLYLPVEMRGEDCTSYVAVDTHGSSSMVSRSESTMRVSSRHVSTARQVRIEPRRRAGSPPRSRAP
jgi:hypothetical protein